MPLLSSSTLVPSLSLPSACLMLCWILGASVGAAGCTPPPGLTEAERQKLDPALQMLVLGEEVDERRYDGQVRADGVRTYRVIVRTSRGEALRARGYAVEAVLGDVVTARLTPAEMREVASLPFVRYVENPGFVQPQ